MTDPSAISQRQRDFEKQSNDRFHEHGKHISRIEGILEERTSNLREANVELRKEVASMGQKIERVEEKLSAKIDTLSTTVGNLSKDVVKQGVYIGFGASIGAGVLSVILQKAVTALSAGG